MKDIKTRLIELVEKKWLDEMNVASKNLQRFEDLRKKKDRTAEEKKMLIKLSKEYNEYRHKKLNCEKKLNDIISLEQKEYSYKDIINVWRRKEDKSVYEERKERIKNTAEKINSEIKNFNCSFERFNGKYNSYTNLLFDSVNSDMKRKYEIFNNIGNLIEPFVKANTNKKMTYAEEHDMNLTLQETYNYVNVNTQKMIKMEEKITDEMVFFPPIKNANKI